MSASGSPSGSQVRPSAAARVRLLPIGGLVTATVTVLALALFMPAPLAAAVLVVWVNAVFFVVLTRIGVDRSRLRRAVAGTDLVRPGERAPATSEPLTIPASTGEPPDDPPAPPEETSGSAARPAAPPPAAPAVTATGARAGTVTDLVVGETDILNDYVVRLPQRVVVEGRVATGFFAGQVPGTTFHVRGVVLRGLEHAALGEEGQDAVGAMWASGHDSVCVGVGDGLGSLRDSAAVSGLAVRTALSTLAASGSRHSLADAFRCAGAELRHLIDAQGLRAATTLALAEIEVVERGAVVSIGTVGDSEVWLFADDAWRPLARRRRDATHALPRSVDARVVREQVPHGAVVVLATDGFALALGEGGSPLARELAKRWRTPPPPLEFVNHVDFKAEDYLDDRGVVAVWI